MRNKKIEGWWIVYIKNLFLLASDSVGSVNLWLIHYGNSIVLLTRIELISYITPKKEWKKVRNNELYLQLKILLQARFCRFNQSPTNLIEVQSKLSSHTIFRCGPPRETGGSREITGAKLNYFSLFTNKSTSLDSSVSTGKIPSCRTLIENFRVSCRTSEHFKEIIGRES